MFNDIYKSEKDKEKEKILTRIVLFEKCRRYDFENNGLKYWYDKNGDVIRIDNDDCSLDIRRFLGFKGETYVEAGYVYAPYVSVFETTTISESEFTPTEKTKSRYSLKQLNPRYYSIIVVDNL